MAHIEIKENVLPDVALHLSNLEAAALAAILDYTPVAQAMEAVGFPAQKLSDDLYDTGYYPNTVAHKDVIKAFGDQVVSFSEYAKDKG